jgi:transcriptional regulator with XRE-family HTH domain
MLACMSASSLELQRACLAANLRQRRLVLGLSQERLALDADIDRTFVSQIERGIGNPSLRILCQLADRLEVDLASLLIKQPEIG